MCDTIAVMTGAITDDLMTGAIPDDMTRAGPDVLYCDHGHCDHVGPGAGTILCYEDWMWTLSLLSRHATVMTVGVLPSACLDSNIGTKQLTFRYF